METLEALAREFCSRTLKDRALTAAELELVRRLPLPVNIGSLSDRTPARSDTITPQSPLLHNVVRAELVRWLCTNDQARKHVDVGGLYINECVIRGTADHAAIYPGGVLDLCSVTVPFSLILHQCTLPPWVLLLGANLPFLDLDGCEAGSVIADVMAVRGDVYLRNRFHAQGSVRLSGARVGGDLDLSGAAIEYSAAPGQRDPRHERGFALNAEGIDVAGDVLLTTSAKTIHSATEQPFRSRGFICLDGAKIGGDLNCEGARLTQPDLQAGAPEPLLPKDTALSFRSAEINGHVWLRKGFEASGAVRLPGAKVKGNLDCEGEFHNPWAANDTTGVVLETDGATIGMNMRLAGTKWNGTVSLVRTTVQGELDRTEASFQQTQATANTPRLTPPRRPALDLRNAHVAYVSFPDAGGDPPAGEDRLLDGFVYERILHSNASRDRWKTYLRWIQNEPFRPQPFVQLSHALRQDGDRVGAREVLVAMEKARPRNRAWKRLQSATIGFGYKPWKLILPWAICVFVGGIIFHVAPRASSADLARYKLDRIGSLSCSAPLAAPTDWARYEQGQSSYPRFQPWVFSVQNSLPLLKFTEWDLWRPRSCLAKVAFLQMLTGWFLTTMAVAGLTNLVRKE
jgi:hypothetical protein